MPCLQLYSFSDTVSQGLALTPELYNETTVTAGDTVTQPLWVRVILVNVYPDARKYVRIYEDLCLGLGIQSESEVDVELGTDGAYVAKPGEDADVVAGINQDAIEEAGLKDEPETATVSVEIKDDAARTLRLIDADSTLSIAQDADKTVPDRQEAHAYVYLGPDAEYGILIEGSDTMEAEACQEPSAPPTPEEPEAEGASTYGSATFGSDTFNG